MQEAQWNPNRCNIENKLTLYKIGENEEKILKCSTKKDIQKKKERERKRPF